MTKPGPIARAGFALVLANVRYWSTVAPLVRGQLDRWEQRARTIGDPALHALATSKLREEHFNAQVAATLATLAPRARRAQVVEAIVALQVLYDYLDALGEQPAAACPPRDGSPPDDRRLFASLTDAVAPPPDGAERAYADDGGYMQALVATVNSTLAGLPGAAAVAPVAQATAALCAEAQILNHRASGSGIAGIDRLREWAAPRAAGTGLAWQELFAGATASVLALHALIAAAADPGTTREDAAELDALYLSIAALSMLDSLVDRAQDIAGGQFSSVELYGDDPEAMASGLANVARDGISRARTRPDGAHHTITLVGVVAYYASAPTAGDDAFARMVIARVKRELKPLIAPTLALMRGWRLAKRARAGAHCRSAQYTTEPHREPVESVTTVPRREE